MATRYAVPGATDWGSTTSWASTLGGSSGASVPADGDTVHLVVPVSFSAGLDQSGIDLAALYVSRGCNSGYVGQSGSPLIISAGAMHIDAIVPIYFQSGDAMTDNLNLYSSPNGNFRVVGGSVGNLTLGREGSVTITGGTVSYADSTGMGITVSASGTLTAVDMEDGSILVYSSIANIGLFGRARARVIGTGVAVTGYVFVSGGCIYTHQSSGAISSAQVLTGGRADATGSPHGFTVSALRRSAGAYAWDTETVSVTVSSTTKAGYM